MNRNLRTSPSRRLALIGGLSMAVARPVVAQTAALDGRRFEGVILQRGKSSGDADTLTFRDRRFRSSACDRYGYSDAAYRSSALGDGIAFEAETVSAKYGSCSGAVSCAATSSMRPP